MSKQGTTFLPTKIKIVVVKIYKYFSLYTIRVTELQNFCNEVNIEYIKKNTSVVLLAVFLYCLSSVGLQNCLSKEL